MAFRTQKISQMTPKGADLEATDLIEVSTLESGSYVTRSITGQELIDAIPPTAIEWGDIGGTLSAQTDLNTALSGKVPTTRTLTINGTTQDLSADRTFTISTGITIGTTAITSGTVGRVLFEGTGNVVQESGNLFWDNTNGRLGINGTPTSPLEIFYNPTGISNTIGLTLNSGSSGSTLKAIRFTAGTFGELGTFGVNTSSGEFRWATSTSYFPTIYSNGAERLRIASTGNVLINTTTDAGFRLDVNGTARVVSNVQLDAGILATSAGNTRLQGSLNYFTHNRLASSGAFGFQIATSNNNTAFWRWDGGSGDTEFGGTGFGGAGALKFYTNNAMRFAITYGGNLLINTTTDAGYKLDVNGTARVSGLVTANGYRITTNGEGLTAVGATTGIVSSGANGATSGYTFTLNNQYGGGNINRNFFAVGDNFFLKSAFSSGTNTVNWLGVYPVINNTGGTTISRGIYYNPTLTSVTGTTHYAFHSTSGNIRFENLPTSPVGLSSGDVWNNLGILTIV